MSFDFKVGDVVICKGYFGDKPMRITAIGTNCFLAFKLGEDDYEYSCYKQGDWQLYKPEPKTVKMAPALYKSNMISKAMISLSRYLFKNKQDAQDCFGDLLIYWPAPLPDENGFYDVPVEGAL